jgi:hypothetical protein
MASMIDWTRSSSVSVKTQDLDEKGNPYCLMEQDYLTDSF